MIKTVGGALFKDGKLLVMKRSPERKRWPGLWEIPRGHVEVNEKPETAIKREFLEETNLKMSKEMTETMKKAFENMGP